MNYLNRQLRALIINDLCSNGYNICINDAVAHYCQWRIDPVTHPIAPAIKSGTTDDYEHMGQLYKQTNDQVEKIRFGDALKNMYMECYSSRAIAQYNIGQLLYSSSRCIKIYP